MYKYMAISFGREISSNFNRNLKSNFPQFYPNLILKLKGKNTNLKPYSFFFLKNEKHNLPSKTKGQDSKYALNFEYMTCVD